jgi:hypothetical protein
MSGRSHTLAALLLGMPWRLREPQGRSGRVRKILPSPGLDSRIVQLVATRYTDTAIPFHVTTDSFESKALTTFSDYSNPPPTSL